MKLNWIITDVIILGTISLVLNFFDIRICPFYNFFKIPCPGCGLTRAFIQLFKFNTTKSISYNFLCIPIFFFFIIYLVFCILKKEDKITSFIKRYEVIIILVSLLFLIISFMVNINNSKLY